jgi:hypothetical protein
MHIGFGAGGRELALELAHDLIEGTNLFGLDLDHSHEHRSKPACNHAADLAFLQ